MIRARFTADFDDYRPVKWPPPGPYWCSGYHGDETGSVVVAYVDNEDQIQEYWPEARQIDCVPDQEIVFTSRFPKPAWWKP